MGHRQLGCSNKSFGKGFLWRPFFSIFKPGLLRQDVFTGIPDAQYDYNRRLMEATCP
jgi:hypothetical protein